MKAHPLQGKINIFFRPIQCEEDGVMLDYELGAKARISRTIFSDDVVDAGWAWLPYKDKWLVIVISITMRTKQMKTVKT